MKKVLIALVLLFAIAACAQQAAAPLPSDAEILKLLQDRIDLYKKGVGMAVGVILPDGSTRTVYYGKLAGDNPRQPDANTVFEIGSATKVFTSLLLADMVTRGELSLDDPVSKFLPKTVKMPARGGKEITLVDLATHTSALPRLPELKPKDPNNPYADYTVEQMYQFLSGYTLTRDIGAQYEYSNLAVGLLGHVLSLRAGSDYESLVRQRICGPLKMTSTAITLGPDLRERLAHGHDEMLQPAANWDIPTLAGAGALRSTVNDLLKFLAANMDPKSPLAAAMQRQLSVRRPTGQPTMQVALGWHILTRFDHDIIWHNGGTGGYHSFMGYDPQKRVGVVVLSNATNSIDDIALHILDSRYELAKLQPPREHKEIKLDPKILDAYVGEYELQPNFVITITREGDSLLAQATGQPRFRLFAETETDFFLKMVDAQLTFVKDASGRVTSLVLHQGGQDTTGKRRPQS